MGKIIDFIRELDQRINSANVLFFDMDSTLVDTNYANYLSYKKAIQSVTHSETDIPYNPNQRFNREILKKVIPSLAVVEYEKIIQEKERYYKDYLPKTKLNKMVADILIKYSKINKIVLVTNCREDRALLTLNYYGLTNKFSNIFYRQKADNANRINKYENAISRLNISPLTVIVFENEKSEIDDALTAGINKKNIVIL